MTTPKIELVRLSSAERRLLPPLNLVQLCVRYTHRRMESYASLVNRPPALPPPPPPAAEPRCPKCVKRRRSCSHLSDGARLPVWGRLRAYRTAAVKSLENVHRVAERSGLSTTAAAKSCDNMLHVHQQPLADDNQRQRQRSPLVWREATRSEEHLAGGEPPTAPAPPHLRGAQSHEYFRKYTIDGSGELVPLGLAGGAVLSQSVPGSPHGFWNKKSNTMPNMQSQLRSSSGGPDANQPPLGKPARRSLSSFLRRLHPRLLRDTLQAGGRGPTRRPWIVVEFQDVDADTVSVRSDDLRDSFSAAHKISLVKSRQSSREQLQEELLESARRHGRVGTPLTAGDCSRQKQEGTLESQGQPAAGDRTLPANGTMFSEKEVLRGSHLTSTRIIMDAQKELRTNGCSQDEVDRSAIRFQRLLQETHTLKTSLRSSEVVKQAVRLLSDEERNGGGGGDAPGSPTQKRPSYVGISCSVSGYSHLTRYTRGGGGDLRSLSRDSSPPGGADVLPTDGSNGGGMSRVSQIKRQLRDGGRLTDGQERGRDGQRTGGGGGGGRPDQPRSLSVDRGYLRQYRQMMGQQGQKEQQANHTANGHRLNGAEQPAAANGSVLHVQRTTTTTVSSCPNGSAASNGGGQQDDETSVQAVVSRSFVQARIERLYGPGALCSGFRRLDLNRSLPNRTTSSTAGEQVEALARTRRAPPPLQLTAAEPAAGDCAAPPASPGLPVFRHLRAEFRQQLPVKTTPPRRPAVPPPADTSPTQTAVPPISAADPPLIACPPTPVGRPRSESELQPAADKAGHKFLKVLDLETTRILAMATRCENDLNARTLSPEIEGKLRAASGKAQLLIAQKFQQFRGLCEKNINSSDDDPFPTTGDDLQGFWDMVLIQVHHIDTIMEELDAIRANNWVLPEVTPPPRETSSASSTPNSKSSSGRRTTPQDPAKAEAARQRSAARKRMMEQRRRLIEEKRRQARDCSGRGEGGDAGVQIFVADDK